MATFKGISTVIIIVIGSLITGTLTELDYSYYEKIFALFKTTTSSSDIIEKDTSTNTGYTGCQEGYSCVAFYLCKHNVFNKNGEGIINIRFDDDSKPKECPFQEICCAVKEQSNVSVITPAGTLDGCGYRNAEGIGLRIVGDTGNGSQYGEFPWMIAVMSKDVALGEDVLVYECGGSLIHPQVVLTAAHCVEQLPAKKLRVRASEWDFESKLELYPEQDRDVTEVMVHKLFSKYALYNDVALLYLNEPFEMTNTVKTVCLPPSNMKFDYSSCFAIGWGKDNFGKTGKYQAILKKVQLSIMPMDLCQNALRATRLGDEYELHPSFMCAGGIPGEDTCKGDGGSPLVCPIPGAVNRYYQAGIVSWGIGCGNGIPGVYARITHLRTWINEIFISKRLNSSSFTP